jgi:hypothetical protein
VAVGLYRRPSFTLNCLARALTNNIANDTHCRAKTSTTVSDLACQTSPPESACCVVDIPDLTGKLVIVTGTITGRSGESSSLALSRVYRA